MDGDLMDAIKILDENGLILPDYIDSNLNSIKEFSSDKEKSISQKRVLIVLDALGSDLLNRVLEKNAGLKTAIGKMEIKTTKTSLFHLISNLDLRPEHMPLYLL